MTQYIPESIKQFYQDNIAQPVEQGIKTCTETVTWGLGKVREIEDTVIEQVNNNVPETMHHQVKKVVRVWHTVLATCLALTGNYVCVLGATLYFGTRVAYALRPVMLSLISKSWSKENLKAALEESLTNFKGLYDSMRPAVFAIASTAAGIKMLSGLLLFSPTRMVLVPLYASIAAATYDEAPAAPLQAVVQPLPNTAPVVQQRNNNQLPVQ